MIDLKLPIISELLWVDSHQQHTYAEMAHSIDFWITKLQQEGIKPGQRIALFIPATPLFFSILFAIWHLEACGCPINLRLPPEGVERYLERLKPHFTIYPSHIKKHADAPTSELLSQPALFIMTSGTTGEPKIAVLTLDNLIANAAGALPFLDYRVNDRWLLTLPLYHVGGIGILIRSVLARAAIVTDSRHPDVTHLSAVPSQLYRASPVYKRLRCLLVGGEPIRPLSPQLPVIASYGLTEMGSLVLAKKKPMNEYLGLPLPGREARLNLEGEIEVRGESLFQGYWNGHYVDKQEGWFGTKDLGRFCPNEGFAIIGRKDRQFISGGENIQPEEIEKCLLGLEGVQEAAVIAVPHPEFGERPAAFIVGSIDYDQMKGALLELLPRYKIPDTFALLDELPKNGLKTNRTLLRQIWDRKNLNR